MSGLAAKKMLVSVQMMDVLSLSGLVLTLAAATPAAAQLKPVEPPKIASAVSSCADAVIVGDVDAAKLGAKGWVLADFTKDGKLISGPLRVYGRAADEPVIMIATDPAAKGICTVIARIATADKIANVADNILSALAGGKLSRKDADYVFLAGGRLALLTPTGTPEAPSVRVAVTLLKQGTP